MKNLIFELYFDIFLNIFINITQWDKYRSRKLLSQVNNYINIWYLNIISEHKSPHYLISYNRKLSFYTRNVPCECTISTITQSYQIDYDVISSLIITGIMLSGTCTIKWYIIMCTPVCVQMVLSKNVLLHIQDENNKQYD